MARSCNVCSHPERDRIEEILVAGGTFQDVSRFAPEISKDSAWRHKQDHLPKTLVALTEQKNAERVRALAAAGKALTVAERVEGLLSSIEEVLENAKNEGRSSIALQAQREIRASLELLAKLNGELRDTPVVTFNLQSSQEWIEIRTSLEDALARHPEAKADVLAAFTGSRPELESAE